MILFHVPARDIARRHLQSFARTLELQVARGRPFDCLITGDDELQRLNREFRKQDYPTDVLSFPERQAKPPAPPKYRARGGLGEIAISYDRARQQARELDHTTQQEIQILLLHGLLHLTGLDHERDRGEMAAAESRWRKRFHLPSGLIERTTA